MLGNLIDDFLREIRLTKSQNTFYNYQKHLEKFKVWCEEQNVNYLAIDTKSIRNFRNWLIERWNLSARSINTILSAVKSFYDFLVADGYVQGNPIVIKRVRVPEHKSQPRFLTDIELSELEKALDLLPERIKLAFELMLATGLRVSEVAMLTKDDLILKNGKLLIRVRQGKGNKERYAIVIDEEVAKKLMELADVSSGSIFGISVSTLKGYAWRIKKITGIDFHCHRLRHTFATKLLAKGVPIDIVQKALGHANISTTRRYAETLPETLERLSVSLDSGANS